ncbi:MAG TPA: Cache 3/Cache 2 fusion domain-containing protein [Gemmatimonadales bacterium]|nr:Cache 3/Cache 2 fusion domain-containing protein [Gemmatimonadales bacterium]
MRAHLSYRPGLGQPTLVAIVVLLAAATMAWRHPAAPAAAEANADRLAATIFSYEGQEFVRLRTTLVTEAGKPAVNTKLEHGSPAYEALRVGHSYSGDVTVFGKRYRGYYAPLTASDGSLTGALFVGVPR